MKMPKVTIEIPAFEIEEGFWATAAERAENILGDLKGAVCDVLGKYTESPSFSVKPGSIKVVETVEIKEAEVSA